MSRNFDDEELRAAYAPALEGTSAERGPDCPPPEALLATVRGEGAQAMRLRTLDHALRCAWCRRELALLYSVAGVGEADARSQVAGYIRAWRRLAPVLAAAALLLAVGLVSVERSRQRVDQEVVRAGVGDELALVAPPASRAVRAELPITFLWHRVPHARRYVLEVLGADGRVVRAAATTDSSAALPSLGAVPPGEYRWTVRAERDDGSVLRSEARRLQVR